MENASVTVSFTSNWNPFFYDLLDGNSNSSDSGRATLKSDTDAANRSTVNSALSFVFLDGGESSSPQPSNESPIRFGSFSSLSTAPGNNNASSINVRQSVNLSIANNNNANNTAQPVPGTPSSGIVASDNDDDVFQPEEKAEDYWKAWNIQTAPGCPALDVLFENKRRWRERFHKAAPPPLQRVCVFCRNTGRSPALFTSHVIRNDQGEITCPVLSAKFCHKCGVKGHTANYCYTSNRQAVMTGDGSTSSGRGSRSISASASSTSNASSNKRQRVNPKSSVDTSSRPNRQMPAYSWR